MNAEEWARYINGGKPVIEQKDEAFDILRRLFHTDEPHPDSIPALIAQAQRRMDAEWARDVQT